VQSSSLLARCLTRRRYIELWFEADVEQSAASNGLLTFTGTWSAGIAYSAPAPVTVSLIDNAAQPEDYQPNQGSRSPGKDASPPSRGLVALLLRARSLTVYSKWMRTAPEINSPISFHHLHFHATGNDTKLSPSTGYRSKDCYGCGRQGDHQLRTAVLPAPP
jgi:hypothetical protein